MKKKPGSGKSSALLKYKNVLFAESIFMGESMHRTSLNIKKEIFDLLDSTACDMNIPITALIKRLIARFSKRYTSRLEYEGSSVSYQPWAEKWHPVIITYTDEEYEQVLNIRKVWKVSVSFFVTMALLHYLYCSESGDADESLRILLHSYMLENYYFEKKLANNIIIFTLIWIDTKRYP